MMFLEPQPRKPCDLNDGDFCLAVSDVTLKHLAKEPRVNYKLGLVLSSFRLFYLVTFSELPGLFALSFQENTECI